MTMGTHTKELTADNFDASIKKGNWVVDFWASWCAPCKLMAPEFEAAARELKGKVHFGKVNVDDNYELAERFQIMAVPSMLFFKNGELVEQTAGALTKEQILKKAKDMF